MRIPELPNLLPGGHRNKPLGHPEIISTHKLTPNRGDLAPVFQIRQRVDATI